MFAPIQDFAYTPECWSRLFSGDLRQIMLPTPNKDWVWTNPSIIAGPHNDYLCAVRLTTAPWTIKGTSVATIAVLTDKGMPSAVKQLTPPPDDRLKISEAPIIHHGAHDCRLFRANDSLFMTATIWDNTAECVQEDGSTHGRIGLIAVSSDFKWSYTAMLPSILNSVEKNWMPVFGELSWLCLPSHNIFGTYTTSTQKFKFAATGKTSAELAFARGSTQLINIGENRLLGVVHFVAEPVVEKINFTNRLRYAHQFVMYAQDTKNLIGLSPYFYFITPGEIEFAAGLTLSHSGDDVIVSFGYRDATAWLACARLSTVLNQMRIIPQQRD